MSAVTSIADAARQRAEARIAHAETIFALAAEMKENAENLQATALKQMEIGRAELRALDQQANR